MHKLCNGKVPFLHKDTFDNVDREMFKAIQDSKSKIESLIEIYKFREALFEIVDLARRGNKYLQNKEPWVKAAELYKNPGWQKLIDGPIHICLQLCANLAIFINPFLPNSAQKMCYMMKVVDKMLDWENAGKIDLLKVGYSLRAPELLFRKIEDEEIEKQIQKLKSTSHKPQATSNTEEGLQLAANSLKPSIHYDDFAKIDLRVGTITNAQKVEKADKLLQLEIDLGFEKRTILSGIALHYTPAQVIGKQVVVVANLAPRKMKGIESQGMILMAEDKEGKLYFVQPETIITNGAIVN